MPAPATAHPRYRVLDAARRPAPLHTTQHPVTRAHRPRPVGLGGPRLGRPRPDRGTRADRTGPRDPAAVARDLLDTASTPGIRARGDLQWLSLLGVGETAGGHELADLDVLVAPGLLVTVHSGDRPALLRLRDTATRARRVAPPLSRSALELLLTATLDAYDDLIDETEEEIGRLQDSAATADRRVVSTELLRHRRRMMDRAGSAGRTASALRRAGEVREPGPGRWLVVDQRSPRSRDRQRTRGCGLRPGGVMVAPGHIARAGPPAGHRAPRRLGHAGGPGRDPPPLQHRHVEQHRSAPGRGRTARCPVGRRARRDGAPPMAVAIGPQAGPPAGTGPDARPEPRTGHHRRAASWEGRRVARCGRAPRPARRP